MLVLIAFGAGVWRPRERAAPSTFLPALVSSTRGPRRRGSRRRFVSIRPGLHVHAACLVELGDGRVRAFWYSGSREGAPDVEIHTAVFDPDRGEWGEEQAVATPEGTQRVDLALRQEGRQPGLGPRAPTGRSWLFYVTVSVGGWGGGSINAVTSRDDGETWGPARRLVSSPFLNLSTIVRGRPLLYADGTIGLPVYQNLAGSVGQLLRLDERGAVIDRQRMGDACVRLQPIVLVRSATEALALPRNSGRERPKRVSATSTRDAGADVESAVRGCRC